jgi:Ca2+:H+ antiporter
MLWRALLLLVPISIALALIEAVPRVLVFTAAILAIVPLAEWVRNATEHVAARAGSAIGGLLNVTFGNAPELILALFVLSGGHTAVVKAQITGSLIGNSLLGLGLAIVAGSFGRERQHFNRERAGLLSSLLILVTIAVMLPALFDYTERGVLRDPNTAALDEHLSLGVAVVLIIVYVGNLIYTLVTHRDLFARASAYSEEAEPEMAAPWPLRRSILILAGATILTAVEAELVSNTVEVTATRLGLTPFFLGVIVLAVVGNAAEYISAVYFARPDGSRHWDHGRIHDSDRAPRRAATRHHLVSDRPSDESRVRESHRADRDRRRRLHRELHCAGWRDDLVRGGDAARRVSSLRAGLLSRHRVAFATHNRLANVED